MVSPEDLGWLAGFFDGEGCITTTTKSHSQLELKIYNTDKALLEKAQLILDGLEIDSILSPHPTGKLGHKPMFRLIVRPYRDIAKFFKKVPVQSSEKLSCWDEFCQAHLNKSPEHTKARRARLGRSYPSLL